MYYKLLILTVIGFGWSTPMSAQLFNNTPDSALDRVIIEKIILKDYEKFGVLVLLPHQKPNELNRLEANKSSLSIFYNYLSSAFDLANKPLKDILHAYQYSLDPSNYRGSEKIKFVKVADEDLNFLTLQSLRAKHNSSVIVMTIVILKNEQKGTCLLYYHLFEEGILVAFLERKGKTWEVVDHKTQTLE